MKQTGMIVGGPNDRLPPALDHEAPSLQIWTYKIYSEFPTPTPPSVQNSVKPKPKELSAKEIPDAPNNCFPRSSMPHFGTILQWDILQGLSTVGGGTVETWPYCSSVGSWNPNVFMPKVAMINEPPWVENLWRGGQLSIFLLVTSVPLLSQFSVGRESHLKTVTIYGKKRNYAYVFSINVIQIELQLLHSVTSPLMVIKNNPSIIWVTWID